jgi:hypothetical protein
MPTAISALDEVTEVSADDDTVLVQAGVTKRVGLDTLQDYVTMGRHWAAVPLTTVTTNPPDSTSLIKLNATAPFRVGLPVRYTYNGTTYYGIVLAVVANTSVSIGGAPLSLAHALTRLEVGLPEQVVNVEFVIPGAYAGSVRDILAAVGKQYCRWELGKGYLVRFLATHATAAGTTQPKLNCKVNGQAVLTSDGGNGLQLGNAGVWVGPATVVDLDTTKYDINRGEAIEIRCTAAQVGTDATDLSAHFTFVLE